MEVVLVEAPSCGKSQPPHLPPSNQVPKALSYADPHADGDNRGKSCSHFSIREYVAGVRKRDPKLCWPFMVDSHISGEQAKLLPPMHVIQFRRWNCRDCLQRTSASTDACEHGANAFEKKPTCSTYIGNAALEKKVLQEHMTRRSVEADSFKMLKDREPLQSVCCHNGPMIKDLKKGGSRFLKNSICNQHPKKLCESPLAKAEQFTGKGSDSRRLIHTSEDAPKLSGVEKSDKLPSPEINNRELSGHKRSKDAHDLCQMKESYKDVQKEATLPGKVHASVHSQADFTVGAFVQGSRVPKKKGHAAYGGTPCPGDSDNESQDHTEQLHSCVWNKQQRRGRRVRLLDDIIKSEELLRFQKVQASDRDFRSRNSEDNNFRKAGLSIGRSQDSVPRRSLSAMKEKLTLSKRKHSNMSSDIQDQGGRSLMHWLRKVSTKSITDEEVKLKLIKTADSGGSKVVPFAHVEKGVGADIQNSSIRVKNKAGSSPCKSGRLLDASMSQKIHTSAEDVPLLQLQSPRTTVVQGAHSLGNGLTFKANNFKKTVLGKRNRTPQHEMQQKGTSSRRWDDNVTDYQSQEKAMKNQNNVVISQQDTQDDFPMDIVELLAKNQHERCQMIAATTVEFPSESQNTNSMKDNHHDRESQMAGMKDGNQDPILNFNRTQGLQGKAQSGNTCKITRSSGCGRPYNLVGDANLNHEVEVNREQSTGFHVHPGFCNFQTNGSHYAVSDLNSMRMELQASKLRPYTERNWGEASCNIANDWSRLLSYGPRDQISSQRYPDIERCCMNKDIQSKCLEKAPLCMYKIDTRRPANSAGAKILHPNDQIESVQVRHFAVPTSYQQCGNRNHFNIDGEPNVYTDGTIPATHLLRLMDPRSCQPYNTPSDAKRMVFLKELGSQGYDQLNKLPRIGTSLKISDTKTGMHRKEFRSSDRENHGGNLSRPLRPLPRFGVLGTLLQNEISAHSKNVGSPFGFGERNSSDIRPEFARRKLTAECQSAFVSRVPYPKTIRNVPSSIHIPRSSSATDSIAQAGINHSNGAFLHVNSKTDQEICSINRNPADFTAPGDDCEFMINPDDLKPKGAPLSGTYYFPVDFHGQKFRKMKNLTALKRLVTS